MENKKVVIGLSGGVDSSVSAYLLKEQGYEVIGATMQTLDEMPAIEDARKVAQTLGIDYYVMDFRKEFKENVINYFFEEYKNGRTPNPCVVCNRLIKWEALMNRAKSLGADYIATGHYARIQKHPVTGRFSMVMSEAASKDQTYVLYNLTQDQLSHTIMPCGEYTKDQIRTIAEKIGLNVANKPDSMEICFIPDNNYVGYIEHNFGYKSMPGDFIDINGNVMGKHKGIINYTVGQRKGLGVSFGKPVYVTSIIPNSNKVILGSNEDLFKKEVCANKVNFVSVSSIDKPLRAKAKIRYAHKAADCTVMYENGILKCIFDEPQRAATPGQALVVYDGKYVLCGGTII